MSAHRLGIASIATLVLAATAGTSAHVPLQPPGSLTVQVNLDMGGAPWAVKGIGDCQYAPGASVHEARGQMWRVHRRDAGRDVTFTEWRLGKVDSFTLLLTVDGKTHRVNTLQVGPSSERTGSGSVRYEQRGHGGQFSINAVADTGLKITGTLACNGFVRPEENGD